MFPQRFEIVAGTFLSGAKSLLRVQHEKLSYQVEGVLSDLFG
jgi:hypothetical protein